MARAALTGYRRSYRDLEARAGVPQLPARLHRAAGQHARLRRGQGQARRRPRERGHVSRVPLPRLGRARVRRYDPGVTAVRTYPTPPGAAPEPRPSRKRNTRVVGCGPLRGLGRKPARRKGIGTGPAGAWRRRGAFRSRLDDFPLRDAGPSGRDSPTGDIEKSRRRTSPPHPTRLALARRSVAAPAPPRAFADRVLGRIERADNTRKFTEPQPVRS